MVNTYDPILGKYRKSDSYININSATALVVEQDGVRDNVLLVDTTNGRVWIGGSLMFRDTALFINSIDDGYIDLTADIGVRLNATCIYINGFLATYFGSNVASAATISCTGSIFHVTGVVTINTINIPYAGFTGQITIIPDGLFSTGVTGNIALATVAVVNKAIIFTYDNVTTKWYPSY
jgi:hypothetical protein